MLGHIESYDERCQTGVVKREGKFYEFHLDQWSSQQPPKAGDDVDFDYEHDEVTDIGPVGAYLIDSKPVKSRIVAALLGVVFGAIGLHRMYLGYWGIAIAQILVTYLTGGFGVVWGFVDGVLIFTGHIYKDSKGRLLK